MEKTPPANPPQNPEPPEPPEPPTPPAPPAPCLEPAAAEGGEGQPLTAEQEEELVRRHLRSLGYL